MPARLAALAVLLSTCPGAPPAGSSDGRALQSVDGAWRSTAGLPDTGACLESASTRRHSDYAEFKASCRNPFSRTPDERVLTGCTTWGFSSVPWHDNYYTIHIAPENTHEHSTVQHESIHVLVICTNLHPNGDALHTDPRLWLGFGPTSVEARARSTSH